VPEGSVRDSANFPLDAGLVYPRRPRGATRLAGSATELLPPGSVHERAAMRGRTAGDPIRSGAERAGERNAGATLRSEPTRRSRNTAEPKHRGAERESCGPRRAALHFLSIAWQTRAASTAPLSLAPIPGRRVILGDTPARARALPFTGEPSQPIFLGAARPTKPGVTCERMRREAREHRLQIRHRRTGSTTKALENRCLKTCLQKRNGLSICSCHPYYGLIVCGGGC
jgi:hypothetical protein